MRLSGKRRGLSERYSKCTKTCNKLNASLGWVSNDGSCTETSKIWNKMATLDLCKHNRLNTVTLNNSQRKSLLKNFVHTVAQYEAENWTDLDVAEANYPKTFEM